MAWIHLCNGLTIASYSWLKVRLLKLETICTHKSCWYHGVGFTESFCGNSFLFSFYLFVCISPQQKIFASAALGKYLDTAWNIDKNVAWWWAREDHRTAMCSCLKRAAFKFWFGFVLVHITAFCTTFTTSHWIVDTFQPALNLFSNLYLTPAQLDSLLMHLLVFSLTNAGESPLTGSATCLCFYKTPHS